MKKGRDTLSHPSKIDMRFHVNIDTSFKIAISFRILFPNTEAIIVKEWFEMEKWTGIAIEESTTANARAGKSKIWWISPVLLLKISTGAFLLPHYILAI